MPMRGHLTLWRVHLRPPEEWNHDTEGLCFVFPETGFGHYASRQAVHRAGPGDVLVLNPEGGGKLCAPVADGLIFHCFSVSADHLYPLLAANELCLLKGVTQAFERPKLYPASDSAARKCRELLSEVPSQDSLCHRAQLLRIVAALLSVEFKAAHPQPNGCIRAEERLLQVLASLSMDEIMECSVKHLSLKFGFGHRHLNRLFRQQFGFSVVGLKMEMRLLKAAASLRDPNRKVLDVAEQCGFNQLGLFSVCFKKRFGLSPSEWRKRSLPAEGETRFAIDRESVCMPRSYGLCPWLPGKKPPLLAVRRQEKGRS